MKSLQESYNCCERGFISKWAAIKITQSASPHSGETIACINRNIIRSISLSLSFYVCLFLSQAPTHNGHTHTNTHARTHARACSQDWDRWTIGTSRQDWLCSATMEQQGNARSRYTSKCVGTRSGSRLADKVSVCWRVEDTRRSWKICLETLITMMTPAYWWF